MTQLLSLRASFLAPACFGLLLFVPALAWSQADTNQTEDAYTKPADDSPMRVPSPVSGGSYDTGFTSEAEESNYLRGGLTITGAYSSNVSGGQTPVGDESYSLWPTITLDKKTTRLHYALTYSPGFTIYQHYSAFNQGNQNVVFDSQYRLSPHVTASLNESFQKTSNIFNQPNPLSVISVSGSAPPPGQAIFPPAGNQLTNATNAQITYQCDENSMIGVSGTYNTLHFSNSTEATGLYGSSSGAGSAFYSRHLRGKYYLGASYRYANISSYQSGAQSNNTNTHTQTQTIFMFFTIQLKPALSISFSGGPQHTISTQSPLPAVRSWSPLTMVSVGWQGSRTSLAASYSRIVSGAGGLNGAFRSNTANASARWQVSRTWSLGASASYSLYNTLTPLFVLASSGGHTVSGTVSVQHQLGEHLDAQAGYSWVQQNYSGSTASSTFPNTNRVFVSISYRFERPLK